MVESQRAKAALQEYLLMGPGRSLAKLCSVLNRPPGYERTLKEWSKTHQWQKRAREYDQEQFEQRRAAHQSRIDKMNEEHYELGKEYTLLAAKIIKDLDVQGKYNPQTANQLLKISTDLQRLSAGATTEQIALVGSKDNDPIDIVVETFWGRGTDPRKRREDAEDPEEAEQDHENDDSEEFSAEIPGDDEWSEEGQ